MQAASRIRDGNQGRGHVKKQQAEVEAEAVSRIIQELLSGTSLKNSPHGLSSWTPPPLAPGGQRLLAVATHRGPGREFIAQRVDVCLHTRSEQESPGPPGRVLAAIEKARLVDWAGE